jgi:glycosyltransferase involved in cell wall biosynthesis
LYDHSVNTALSTLSTAEQPALPLISIVIPTYNRLPFIVEATRSVIAQTYTNWELIIVDDGSTDGTAEAINSIADPRILVTELPHKGTARLLRNIGIRIGTGEWVSFLDSDDRWLPRKLELQLKALKQSGLECCYTNFELIDETGKIMPARSRPFRPLSGNIIRELISNEASLAIDTLLLSRRLFNDLNGFSTDPKLYREDYEFELRLALNAELIALPEVLVQVREHAGRATKAFSHADSHVHSAIPYEKFIKGKPGKELEKLAAGRYIHHMRQAAKINFKNRNYRLAFQQLRKSITGIT